MSCESIERLLEEHPFLKDLHPKYLRWLACCARSQTFQRGEYLWRQGQHADMLFLIRSGEVALEISIPAQGPLPIATVAAGDVLGWSWLAPPHRSRFDARAVTNVQTVALDAGCIREKCEQDEGFGYQLLKRFTHVIADRLEMTRLRLLEQSRV